MGPESHCSCPHPCPLCRPEQSAALAEREKVSRLFTEAAAILQGFQAEVLGFIEEGEATMLGRSQGDLRRQEEQRSRLSRARHNLSQVPEADSVSFLQVRTALLGQRGHGRGSGKEWGGQAGLPGLRGCAIVPQGFPHSPRSWNQQGLTSHFSGTGAPGIEAGPGGGVRPWARPPEGAQLHKILPSRAGGERCADGGLCQPVGAAAGVGR